ncbi:hypothetical protein GCM10009817_26730 [Terrabacter lapilli]|uniref:Secreted protein n=1 Tax=Terrabacter lapilli TaxID=436231 RepID=A0ABP5DSQ1_9MICO
MHATLPEMRRTQLSGVTALLMVAVTGRPPAHRHPCVADGQDLGLWGLMLQARNIEIGRHGHTLSQRERSHQM